MNDLMNEGDMEETEKINVVPLADLTLVLLIILMVLSPMISQSMIRVATPQVQSAGPAESSEGGEEKIPLFISISETGYSLNNVSFEELDPLLSNVKEKLLEDKDRPVIVSASDGVFVGQVVEVLDGSKQQGAREVSLVKSVGPERSQ
ncbi:MAG: biopolymer transporter ExbD [Elusimicrobia bacterium]|nr:biopolymer transporter ExbD [Elusimicrobiota bacterium]